MLQDRWLYESSVEVQMARWKSAMAVLKAEAQRADTEAAAHYDEFIDALQHRHDVASHHLSSLRGASDEAWQGVKEETEQSWMSFTAILQDPVPNR